jgi:hypothetical protein
MLTASFDLSETRYSPDEQDRFVQVSSCTQPVDSLSFVVNELRTALNLYVVFRY